MPIRVLLVLIICCVYLADCKSDDELDGKDFDYVVTNSSDVEVGITITSATKNSNFVLLLKTVVLKPGEKRVILKSNEQKEPSVFISLLEVYDKNLETRYKVLDLGKYSINGSIVNLDLWMPSPNSHDVVKNNYSVNLYLDETSIFGFCPKSTITFETYYFDTQNDFMDLHKVSLPQASYFYDLVGLFGNTIIARDESTYAQNTTFIRSINRGGAWTPFFSIFNGTDRDFLDADFINENEGWLFTYNYWDSTLVFKVNNGEYNRISCLKGYCVVDCKFIDSNRGYAVANPKDNVSPSSSPNSYFFKTTDGGAHWDEPVLISSTESPAKFFAFPSGKMFLMRNNAHEMHRSYYYSEDEGKSWELVDTGIDGLIRDMHFISDEVGFIKTGDNSLWSQPNSGFLFKTIDGGKNWVKIPSVSLLGSKVYFYNEQIGYLQDVMYGKGQVLLVTRDGGKTWKDVLYPFDYLTE